MVVAIEEEAAKEKIEREEAMERREGGMEALELVARAEISAGRARRVTWQVVCVKKATRWSITLKWAAR